MSLSEILHNNNPNLLSKKSEFVNSCCHQSKLLLRGFKRIDTVREMIQWIDILFYLSNSVFNVSVCCSTFCGILKYS